MSYIQSTIRLQRELIARGLVPPDCRLIEVSITPAAPLVIRYEVFVRSDRLALFAEAMTAAAASAVADDEALELALQEKERT